MNTIYNILTNLGPKIEPDHIPDDCVAVSDSEPTLSDNMLEKYRTREHLAESLQSYVNQNVFVAMTSGFTYVGRFEPSDKSINTFTVGTSKSLLTSDIQTIRVV